MRSSGSPGSWPPSAAEFRCVPLTLHSHPKASNLFPEFDCMFMAANRAFRTSHVRPTTRQCGHQESEELAARFGADTRFAIQAPCEDPGDGCLARAESAGQSHSDHRPTLRDDRLPSQSLSGQSLSGKPLGRSMPWHPHEPAVVKQGGPGHGPDPPSDVPGGTTRL